MLCPVASSASPVAVATDCAREEAAGWTTTIKAYSPGAIRALPATYAGTLRQQVDDTLHSLPRKTHV